jgi:hypothetical protein
MVKLGGLNEIKKVLTKADSVKAVARGGEGFNTKPRSIKVVISADTGTIKISERNAADGKKIERSIICPKVQSNSIILAREQTLSSLEARRKSASSST